MAQANPKIRTHLQEIYTDKYGYQLTHYDGSFLELPAMNPEISLYSHQRSAIARIILSENNVLLSHDVGAGKILAFAAGIHERLRTGLSRKALLVVPNAMFDATVQAIHQLYPDESFTPICVKDFTPSKRDDALKQIIYADSGFFMLDSSSICLIGMSKQYHLDKRKAEITDCEREIHATADCSRKNRLYTLHEKLTEEYRKPSAKKAYYSD